MARIKIPLTHTVNGKTYSKVSKYVPKHEYNIQVGWGHVSSKGTYSKEVDATKKAVRHLAVLASIREANKKVVFNHETNEILVH